VADETIFFDGILTEGAPFLDADRVVVEVLHDDDEHYRFSFTLEPVPGPDPQRVRVIMHRVSNQPPLVEVDVNR
jgi:hypothetical protein